MSKPAVFEAEYYNFEYKKGLKVCRLTFEVPYEHAGIVRQVLGDPPLGGAQVRVGIARLTSPPAEQPSAPQGAPTTEPDTLPQVRPSGVVGEGQETRRTYTRSQMAAILCDDAAFQGWAALLPHSVERRQCLDNIDYTRCILLDVLGITSRKELDTLPHKSELWDRLKTDFDMRTYQ